MQFSKKIIRDELYREDTRAVLGYVLAIVLGAALISSVVVMGTTQSDRSESPGSEAAVAPVEEGLTSGFEETNEIVLNQNTEEFVLDESKSVSWSGLSDVGQANIGSLLSKIEKQQEPTGKVTRVSPAGDGINNGAVLKQWGGDEYETEGTYSEYHEVEETYTDTREVTDTRMVTETRTRTTTEEYKYWYTEEHIHHYHEWIPYQRQYSYTDWTGRLVTYTMTDYRLNTWYEIHYHDVYEWRTREVEEEYEVEVEEEYTYEEEYEYTETHEEQREVTDTVTVGDGDGSGVGVGEGGGTYTYDGQSDWTMMTGVNDYRDSVFVIQQDGLANLEENAFTMSADSWEMKIWDDDGDVRVETTDGFTGTYDGAITINPSESTITGDVISTSGQFEFAGNEGSHAISVSNGENAFGNYRLITDGTVSDPTESLTEDTDSAQAALSVGDNIVYSADLDVTYEAMDTTVTTRLYLEPGADPLNKPA